MRSAMLLATLLLAAGCGKETVADRIDAMRKSGVAREALLPPAPPMIQDGPKLPARLRESEDGKALLEEADKAVPDLIRLLGDPDRGKLATAFLAEIGGTAAAQGLLDRWRELRHVVMRKCLFRVPDVGASLGCRFENVDDESYGELLDALCYTGRAVSASIASDTEAALAECERLRAAGAELTRREARQEDGRGVELRWSLEPIETAREGLTVLATSGAPEAPALVARALRLEIRALRRAALKCVVLLGGQAEPLIPDLARLLDDPEWHDETREQLSLLVSSLPEGQRREIARRYADRLREGNRPPR